MTLQLLSSFPGLKLTTLPSLLKLISSHSVYQLTLLINSLNHSEARQLLMSRSKQTLQFLQFFFPVYLIKIRSPIVSECLSTIICNNSNYSLLFLNTSFFHLE